MSYTFPVSLGKAELITERPFSHTDHITKDREILVHMARQICMVLEQHPDILGMYKSIYIDEPDGYSHRYFVPRPTILSETKEVYLVGFFSFKRKGAVKDHFGDLDDRLVEQIPTLEEILSYSTMALPDGNFSNLVLLSDEAIKLKWMQGETHKKAISLSPGYYQCVRINNGMLPYGVLHPEALRITRVKYYDYGEDPPWKAIRELT
ncbi:MAG: hypothetical protein WBL25_16465 [Anaerolineales bacterium]